MLRIEHDISLASHTTFKIGGPAREFVRVETAQAVLEALGYAKSKSLRVVVLGGGSNMLVSDAGFDGLVIEIVNRGIDVWQDDSTHRLLAVASGETWDDVVKYSVEQNLWGVENLSRIPGKAGAVAVQNVGAYGEEAKYVIVSVEVFDRSTHQLRTLSNEECHFTYRKSIFNTTDKDRYIILSTLFRLSTVAKRNLDYPDVRKYFVHNPEPTQREIRQAIIEIRDRKFPFPAESVEGNAGSFFKNSSLSEEEYALLERTFETNLPESLERLREIRHKFPIAGSIKIPSAFIFDVCGLKGFRMGDVMLNPSQPVVVLNVSGKATAHDVLTLVREVRAIVGKKTGLHLLTEPELIGFTAQELGQFGFTQAEIDRYVGAG